MFKMEVIFDTNPYRYLASGKKPEEIKPIIARLRAAEAAHGIRAWAAPTVWLELFYHVGVPGSRDYDDCLAAVVACYLHTRAADGKDYLLAPRATMLQAHTLFGHKDEEEDRLLKTMDYIAGEINKKPNRETIEKYAEAFGRYRQFVSSQEDAFMKRFEKEKNKLLKDDPLDEMYIGLAQIVATHLGMNPGSWSSERKAELARMVKLYFPAPFQLYLEIRKRFIENPKLDITKGSKRNWYWDHDMLFYISKQNSMALVTNDKAMITAAGRAGLADKAKRLEDYLRNIGVDLAQLKN
jgi:hypothetical protein